MGLWRKRRCGGPAMDLETRVKLNIYTTIAETTRPPTSAEVARALGESRAEVEGAFRSLARKRLLVLDDANARIRMAPPFSGVATGFQVTLDGRTYFANCVWDALGVAAALHRDADIKTTCGDCGEPMRLRVRDAAPVPQACVIHFAVPAALWWEDVVYT